MATGDIGSYSFITVFVPLRWGLWVCPRSPCVFYYHFGLHSKEGSCVICWVNFSTFRGYSEFVFGSKVSCEGYSFLCTINSNTAFLFSCLNICFCDRRIHFRFPFASIEVQSFAPNFRNFLSSVNYRLLPSIAGLVLWSSKRKCDWRRRGKTFRNLWARIHLGFCGRIILSLL